MSLHVAPGANFIHGIGGVKVSGLVGQVLLSFSSLRSPYPQIKTSAIVLDNILGQHPVVPLPSDVISLTSGLSLADPDFRIPGPVDVLLGADVIGLLRLKNNRLLQVSGLSAISTDLGDVIMGPAFPVLPSKSNDSLQVGISLADAVQRFWEIEEPPTAPRVNAEHQECELFYQNNTGRLHSGQFVTRLPFLPSRSPLGQSRMLAEKRLTSMEGRMNRDADFRQNYINFMREYLKLGHMSVSKFDWRSKEHYFIPHHAVFKGGKIRVVFDGSAPTSNGVTLNQCLYTGLKLQRDISDLLTNFRRHRVVFVADIKMMFRQTLIHPDERCYQLILWREDPSKSIDVYELNTNTYGLKSSPFIAIRSLLELADRKRIHFSRAAAILSNDVYVDDICTGADSDEDAKVLRDELIGILRAGGYELRKWTSNSQLLLKDLPEEHQQAPHLFQNIENPNAVAVLGVQYQPVLDVFAFRVQDINIGTVWTKRVVLSTVARIFDPNGWLAPVVFWAKCFLQKLWLQELAWDTPLTGELIQAWSRFTTSLPQIQLIKIGRAFFPTGRCRVSLHGFSDASERGYAAAVYLRVVDQKGIVTVKLVMAKSKVAPVRSRLIGVTVSWLRASVHALEIFVANRVSQIQNSNTVINWRHVPGNLNPADCASRGCESQVLVNHDLWWGPAWLCEPESSWPHRVLDVVDPLPGLRVFTIQQEHINDLKTLLNKFSSLNKLLGVTGWIKRFIYNLRHKGNRQSSPVLDPEERYQALEFWVHFVQRDHLGSVVLILQNKRVKLKGAIARLNPFLDKKGLVRVGGRLRNVDLPYEARHPLLLPKDDSFVTLLINDRHMRNAHAGLNTLLAILQREFWILSGRRAIRKVLYRCMPCYRLKATLSQPQMGDLPPDRVKVSRPFSGVGTDFAGPFIVKSSSLRKAQLSKAYLCVFVCLSTKAVHLEVVSSLSTEAFVACLSRFVSRQGLPSLIQSDCGTNFKGCDRYLLEVHKFLLDNKNSIKQKMSQQGIQWKFDPPAYPSWGGIFEAVVKVAKTHLRRIIGETVLTFEELQTVFCKIEAVINSRPLCSVSSDPNDLEVLTPGHFLVGCPLTALPEYLFEDTPVNRLTRFELLQQLSQSFWRRFNLEYFHLLQQRVRWSDKTQPPKVGDLVLVKEMNMPPLSWRRGRILRLFPGADGIPRVAEVHVGNSVLKRAVATLSRLSVA